MRCKRFCFVLFVAVVFTLFMGACDKSPKGSPEYGCGVAVHDIRGTFAGFSEERAERMFYRCLQAVEKRSVSKSTSELDGGI